MPRPIATHNTKIKNERNNKSNHSGHGQLPMAVKYAEATPKNATELSGKAALPNTNGIVRVNGKKVLTK